MAVQVLQPGAVTVDSNPHVASTLVGPPPEWADGSDATYSQTWLSRRSSLAVAGAMATLDTFTGDVASATDVTLSVRAATNNAGGATLRYAVFVLYRSSDSALIGQFMNHPDYPNDHVVNFPDADSTIYELDVSTVAAWDAGGARAILDPSTVALALSQGCYIYARRQAHSTTDPSDFGLTIYELSVSVTSGGAPQPLYAAPLRLTQRGDGLAGGAPRLTGSRSRQASNRLLGGYL